MKRKKIDQDDIPSMLTLAEGAYEVPEQDGDKPVRCTGVAYSGGSFRQWWSALPCYVDLSGMRMADQVCLMYNHDYDPECRLGVIEARNDGKTLTVDGEFDTGNVLAQSIIRSGRKFDWQLSIGAENVKVERVDEGTVETINGNTVNGPAIVVRESILREVSIVAIGADAKTSMEIKASLMAPEPDGTATSEGHVVQAVAQAEPAKVETESEPTTEEDIDMEELNSKLNAITDGLTKLSERIEATEKRIETQASRPAPEICVKTDDTATADVLQAAVEQAMGVTPTDTRAAEIADRKYRGQMGLKQLYTECAHAGGWNGYLNNGNLGEAVSAIKASFSVVNLPGILSSAINKRIKAGWDYAEDSWRRIADITSVSDYKQFSTYVLNSKGDYEEVANGGTIPTGELAETSYTNQLKRYGLMFSIDEMDIINDDMGAINQRAFQFGRKASLKLNQVFWTLFQTDADFFKVANNNIVTAAGALSADSLAKLVKAFRKQTDVSGDILGYEPRILLVPAALEVEAQKLYFDAEIRDTTASKQYLTGNPWRNKFVPVASAYLTSDDDYYLLADPTIAATMQVAFLNGQQAPVVESNPTNFDTFGISYRGKFSFGVAFMDAKAGIKGVKA